jgi:hypothetical protein
MKKQSTSRSAFFSVIFAVIILVAIVHGANGVTYSVSRSWTDGIGTANLVGTVDVPLGNYTIMNGGAAPFTNVSLTLTLNGSSAFLDHADTSQIFGSGQFFIDATLSSLTFDTANADEGNPADLNFFDATNTTRYVTGSNGNPGFEAGYSQTDGVIANLSFPVVFGTAGEGGLTLVSAASVQRGFAIDLPISGPSGVEDRSGKPNKKFTITMTFSNDIASVGSADSTCGSVSGISIDGNTVTINLVNVAHGCNGTDITITANDIVDTDGNSLSSASVLMGLLLGDVNGDRVVDRADVNLVQQFTHQKINSHNFRADVSNDGFINRSDKDLVRQQLGTSLP